jgi:hypothetical protein
MHWLCPVGRQDGRLEPKYLLAGTSTATSLVLFGCTWAQDERPADLHMAQPDVPVSKTLEVGMQGACRLDWYKVQGLL